MVGILQPLLAYLLARELFDEFSGLVAAALMALYSYFIYYSATLMTEPFYITAILASLYLSIRLAKSSPKSYLKYAIGLGLAIGIAALLRQLYLLFAPFIFAWVIWVYRKRHGHSPLKPLVITLAIILVMILPITIYNYIRFDQFVLLNSNAGYAFFWSNHPIYGTRFLSILPSEMGSYADLIPSELRGLNEVELDQALLRRGLEFVIQDPVRYLFLSLSRIPVYFTFWPTSSSSLISNIARVASFGLMVPFMILGLFYALSRRKNKEIPLIQDPTVLLIGFTAVYSLIHLLSWSLIRYRLPVDAVLIVFAGLALTQIFRRLNISRLKHRTIQPSKR
jgi:4-amino-4-deoxy-L-arabinose transferase-like glycosyltransferase